MLKVKRIRIEIANSVFNVVQQTYIHTYTKLVLSIVFLLIQAKDYNVLDKSLPSLFSQLEKYPLQDFLPW